MIFGPIFAPFNAKVYEITFYQHSFITNKMFCTICTSILKNIVLLFFTISFLQWFETEILNYSIIQGRKY